MLWSFLLNNFVLIFVGGLGNLEELKIYRQNFQDSLATAYFTSHLPNLKVLQLSNCNLTNFNIPPASAIANLETLILWFNPLLDIDGIPFENFKKLRNLELVIKTMSASAVKKFPNTLVELMVYYSKENFSAVDFQHLNKLEKLTIWSDNGPCDCDLYNQLTYTLGEFILHLFY